MEVLSNFALFYPKLNGICEFQTIYKFRFRLRLVTSWILVSVIRNFLKKNLQFEQEIRQKIVIKGFCAPKLSTVEISGQVHEAFELFRFLQTFLQQHIL